MLLRYLLGFRRLGWQVVFVDMVDDATLASGEVAYLQAVMRDFGFEDSFSLLQRDSAATVGMPRARMLRAVRSSAMLLNVMGYVDDEEVLASAPRRVFLDIDPGFPQMWRELGLHDGFAGYDSFVSIGENIGDPACEVPTCGLDWKTTTQPVVLDLWPAHGQGERLTSVATWRGAFGPIDFRGKTYGLRVHEFRQFAELPQLTDISCELALSIDPSETADLSLLTCGGWNLVDPVLAAAGPDRYRSYIQASRAEFMVAKNMYVETHSGWFSDRSACYLASGKPVLAQRTGWEKFYPAGEGLFAFSTLEEAAAGVREIVGNYAYHSRRAREIACEFFDSDKVLGSLLTRLAVG